MSLTESTMLPLGTAAPDFSLTDAISGTTVSLSDFKGAPALVMMFICNHCPFVVHLRDALGPFTGSYKDQGVAFVAVNSNDIEKYPQDAPENMKTLAEGQGWTFPFLLDSTQEVAKAYRAACTPDFYVFDGDYKLRYRGQFDDSRPENGLPVTGDDLRAAIDGIMAGRSAAEPQTPSIGCNIKWKPGNEPDYFGSR